MHFLIILMMAEQSNSKYEEHIKAMEESLVKLRLSELARIRSKAEARDNMSPITASTQKDGRYYLVRLEMEREKIKSMIDSAEQDARLSQVPEDVLGKIRNAIGKAQLLITKRFKQFEELCRDNIENDPDKKETKSSDLLGYWEMMFIQIDDVTALFTDIAKIKANDWKSVDTLDGHATPPPKLLTPKSKDRKSTGTKSPRSKSAVDTEKVKREAKSRLAAARKQAKLRMQQEQKEKFDSSDTTNENLLNSSLNGSLLNGDISMNSSLNSSIELLNTEDSPETQSPASGAQSTASGAQSPASGAQSPIEKHVTDLHPTEEKVEESYEDMTEQKSEHENHVEAELISPIMTVEDVS